MIGLPLRERVIVTSGGLEHKQKEVGLDCEIVYDMATLSRDSDYTRFVLVAGDEEYARTVRRIREETKIQVCVAFFSEIGCANSLMREATKFIDLNVNTIFRDYRTASLNPSQL
jgi:uncharacterized LabA/DUF88 family protein